LSHRYQKRQQGRSNVFYLNREDHNDWSAFRQCLSVYEAEVDGI
jgi:hypothetical protein